MDEMVIEVAEAQKGLKFFNFGGVGPFGDALYFGWIHADTFIGYNDTEVFHGGLIEEALFWLQIKVVFDEVS